ncbi:MAG: hypothetical protein M5U34_46780 [Chloroflexi bacterium]|nr:hypothetical protein [Chloroflexota bacterium]
MWTPEELLAWPRERVLLYTRRERPCRCLAQQLLLPPDWPRRAPPLPPRQVSMPRNAHAWLPLAIEKLMDPDFLTNLSTLPEPVMPKRALPMEIAEKRETEKPAAVAAPPIPPQASETKTKKPHEPASPDVR